jgi:transcription initiation factor TFIIB
LQKNQKVGSAASNVLHDTSNFQTGGTTSAENLMPRACNKLGLPTTVQLVAEECARVVTDAGIAAGRSPLSIAGAVLYLVSHLMQTPKTPKEIGLAVEVSDGTIRTAYKYVFRSQTIMFQLLTYTD